MIATELGLSTGSRLFYSPGGAGKVELPLLGRVLHTLFLPPALLFPTLPRSATIGISGRQRGYLPYNTSRCVLCPPAPRAYWIGREQDPGSFRCPEPRPCVECSYPTRGQGRACFPFLRPF